MTFRHTTTAALAIALAASLASCVDDKYDLSDIDTTVQVKVNDLTIPVNLDAIELKSILEEGDEIKIVDGQYAITEDGDFNSSPINIGAVNIASQKFNPTVINIPYVPAAVTAASGAAGHFPIELEAQAFKFTATDIPSEITGVSALGGELEFIFTFHLSGINSIANRVELQNLELQLPKGLRMTDVAGGTYDPMTGIANIPAKEVKGEKLTLTLKADRVDIETMDAVFNSDAHSLEVSGDFYVKSGSIAIAKADLLPGTTPTQLKLTVDYEIPDFTVSTFSGRVKYTIDGVDISDVDLSDLPDVLTQEGTDISIVNPCIYISLENALGRYGLTAQTGMTITSYHGDDAKEFTLNAPGYFIIDAGGEEGKSSYCLSPVDPSVKLAGYESAKHVPFTELSGVLSGEGLPSRLGIKLNDPNVNDQPVVDLPLGSDIGEVKGSYEFFAPIALCTGSKIVYSDVADGWGSEDLDHLTITDLHVRASIACEIPLALDAMAYPIDKDGNDIDGVKIEGAKLTAGSEPQTVDIHITGEIKGGLDGIRYEVTATAGSDETPLKPDMKIIVTNLRPSVSGYYEKEL
ncbi:MAG: hypothetical protein K2J12_04125 [Muribaculaceae bacterium]|nr:hypothetical protein [Muribaculaceae bacterium]